MDRPNYITPAGYAAMRAEYRRLFETERPALVETISWAAGNGDRSENGDYIYGRKRLREIDRALDRLSRKMKAAQVVDPSQQPERGRVFFGATVTIADEDDVRRTVTLVGEDEADAGVARISWASPLARALRGAAAGDLRRVVLPGGEREWEVIAIAYPDRANGTSGGHRPTRTDGCGPAGCLRPAHWGMRLMIAAQASSVDPVASASWRRATPLTRSPKRSNIRLARTATKLSERRSRVAAGAIPISSSTSSITATR